MEAFPFGRERKKGGAYKTLEHNTLIYNIDVKYHNGDNFGVTVASPSKRENHLGRLHILG